MPAHQPRLLFIDAYDSFSENIISLLRHLLHTHIDVIKVDTDIAQTFNRPEETFLQQYHAIVLGPGPGNPLDDEDVGLYQVVWRIAATHQIPVLGICLGFQSLCATFGLGIEKLGMPCHGHAKQILHEGAAVFEGVGEVVATCYNSLGVRLPSREQRRPYSRPRSPDSGYESKPVSSRTSFDIEESVAATSGKDADLSILAWDDEGWVQAVKHDSLPFCGLQFHPESCKSNDACSDLLKRWWTAVTEHNTNHRPNIPSSLPTRPQSQLMQLRSRSQPHQPILDVLNRLCPPTLNRIEYRTIHSSATRSQIAHLCHQLCQSERLCMIESSKKGRYSIYAVTDSSTWTLEYAHDVLEIISDTIPYEHPTSIAEAMDLIESFLSDRLISDGPADSPFWGGLIGYFSYELGLDLLAVKDPLEDPPPREVPDYSLTWIDRSIVVDKDTGTIHIQSLRPNDNAFLTSTVNLITALTPTSPTPPPTTIDLTTTTIQLPSHTHYTRQINQCLSHLHLGNSYELCLTTPATVSLPTALPTFPLHQHLLTHNPSTYSALLALPSVTIHSLSPEQFLSWPRATLSNPGTELTMSPMKGTLAKTPTMTRDDAKRLLGTRKEEAENLMIVDLIRHDLHRALAGSSVAGGERSEGGQDRVAVQVDKLFELVEAETVWQLISCVVGRVVVPSPPPSPPSPPPSSSSQSSPSQKDPEQQLRQHRRTTLAHAMNALRTTLPPGSMTGAPKKRSCEILRGLEGRNRGVYAGVLGYFDVGGGGAWSVAIRCAFSAVGKEVEKQREENGNGHEAGVEEEGAERERRLQGKRMRKWHVAAGGAITVLSDVEGEWEEMRVKMESVLRAFQ